MCQVFSTRSERRRSSHFHQFQLLHSSNLQQLGWMWDVSRLGGQKQTSLKRVSHRLTRKVWRLPRALIHGIHLHFCITAEGNQHDWQMCGFLFFTCCSNWFQFQPVDSAGCWAQIDPELLSPHQETWLTPTASVCFVPSFFYYYYFLLFFIYF